MKKLPRRRIVFMSVFVRSSKTKKMTQETLSESPLTDTYYTSSIIEVPSELYRTLLIGLYIAVYLSVFRLLIFLVTGYTTVQISSSLFGRIVSFAIALLPGIVLFIPDLEKKVYQVIIPAIPGFWLLLMWINVPLVKLIGYVLLSGAILLLLPDLIEIQLERLPGTALLYSTLVGIFIDLILRGINSGRDPIISSTLIPRILISLLLLGVAVLINPVETNPTKEVEESHEDITMSQLWGRNLGIVSVFVGLLFYSFYYANAGVLYPTFSFASGFTQVLYNVALIIIVALFLYYLREVGRDDYLLSLLLAAIFSISLAFYPWYEWSLIFLPITFGIFLYFMAIMMENADILGTSHRRSLRASIFVVFLFNIAFFALSVLSERQGLILSLPAIFIVLSLLSGYLSKGGNIDA